MATYTEHYNLKKPAETDFVDIADINENMNAIDGAMSNLIPKSQRGKANGVATLDEEGKIPVEQLPSGCGMLPRLEITVDYDTQITVTDGKTTLSDIITDDTVSFDLPNFGDWSIITDFDKQTITIDTVKIYKITVTVPVLNDTTWEQIAEMSENGRASSLWLIGDEKEINVNGETLTFQIYDFNHDNLTGGGKAGITFGMKNLMSETRQMNSSDRNTGSFTGSDLYNWLENTFFPAMPEELKGLIKAVDKKTSIGGASVATNVESMKLFLFSLIETKSTTQRGYKEEGETYPIFTDKTSLIKYLENGAGSSADWWLRSPFTGNRTNFNTTDKYGINSNAISNVFKGICFGFCV